MAAPQTFWGGLKYPFSQEGGKGLLASPMFNVGMGLLAHRQNADQTSLMDATVGGLSRAQAQQMAQAEEERQQQFRAALSQYFGGGGQPGAAMPPTGVPPSAGGGILPAFSQQMPAGTAPQAGGLLAEPPTPPASGQGSARMIGPFMGVNPRGGGTPGAAPNPSDSRQVLGLLAQVNPELAAKEYLDYQQQNNPQERFLRMYGQFNPRDYTEKSFAKFHELNQQGLFDPSVLVFRDELNSKETGYLGDAITGAQKAEANLGRINMLAGRFDEMARQGVLQGKIAGGIGEFMKSMLGSEDAVTQLRTEYEQLRTQNVIQDLPPGVASDRDVAIVMKGWPTGVADPAHIASFLRGMQKLRAIDLAQNSHRAEYLSNQRKLEGLLEDWNKTKEWRVQRAIDSVGGVNTLDPQEYWRQYYGNTQQATSSAATGPLTQEQLDKMSDEEFLNALPGMYPGIMGNR